MVEAFPGNEAEIKTILPSTQAFQAAHNIPEVVADAGILSDANLKALAAARLRFIVGQKIPKSPTRSSSGSRPNPARRHLMG